MSETGKPTHRPRDADLAKRQTFDWRPKSILALFKDSAAEWAEDKAPKQAAALAYYTLFALGPLLVLAISIAALVFGPEAAQQAVVGQLSRLTGEEGGEAIGEMLQAAESRRAGAFGAVFGLLLLLFAAGAVFAQLKEALNRIWEVEAKKRVGWKAKVFGAVRKNMTSFVGVLGTGFLLLVSLLVGAALAAFGTYLQGMIPGSEVMWLVLNFLISVVVVSVMFAFLYKFMPDVRVAWRDVWIGAAVTAVLFMLGQIAIGVYLGSGAVGRTFGAGSALIVVLVWIYYSSLIVFFGAEFTQVYANRYGSHVRPNEEARPLVEAVAEEQSLPQREGIDERPKHNERGRGV